MIPNELQGVEDDRIVEGVFGAHGDGLSLASGNCGFLFIVDGKSQDLHRVSTQHAGVFGRVGAYVFENSLEGQADVVRILQIGRASCRERV